MSGDRSRRAWGWHPLDDRWAARVVAEARVRPGELVVDLGAGNGALTRHLVAAGARVLAVELHRGRASGLRAAFADAPVTVVECDVRTLRLPGRPFRVVASPPYHASSAVVRLLLAADSRLTAADLVLPRVVVHRFVRRWQAGRRWQLHAGLMLPRNAFRPPPQVDSGVLVVRRR